MLKISVIQLLLRVIPESFFIVLGSYVFSLKKFDKNLIIISSLCLAIIIYLVRSLPISFGVHTILIMLIYILIISQVNKIPLVKTIPYILIMIILMSVLEAVNLLIPQSILNIQVQNSLLEDLLQTIYTLPSLIVFGGLIGLSYKLFYKRRYTGDKNVSV